MFGKTRPAVGLAWNPGLSNKEQGKWPLGGLGTQGHF